MVPQGDPYDNAVAENFFSCLKCELVHLRRYYSRRAAQADPFAYIEAFYNTVRPHTQHLASSHQSAFEQSLHTAVA